MSTASIVPDLMVKGEVTKPKSLDETDDHMHDMYSCLKCSKVFQTLSNLIKHSLEHAEVDEPLIFSCPKPKLDWSGAPNQTTPTLVLQEFHCRHCSEKFYRRKDLLQHVETAVGVLDSIRPVLSDHCSIRLSTRAVEPQLPNPAQNIIPCRGRIDSVLNDFETSTRKSPDQGGNSDSNDSLNNQQQRNSQLMKYSFKCHLCNGDFPQSDELFYHFLENHPTNMYKCVKCRQTFEMESELLQHAAAVHLVTKPHGVLSLANLDLSRSDQGSCISELPFDQYGCLKCYKVFSTVTCLLIHAAHHDEADKPLIFSCHQPKLDDTGSADKKTSTLVLQEFHCRHCSDKFYRRKDLLQHVETAVGVLDSIKPVLSEHCSIVLTTRTVEPQVPAPSPKILPCRRRIHSILNGFESSTLNAADQRGHSDFNHQNIQPQRNFQLMKYSFKCHLCNDDFPQADELFDHYPENHPTNKYKCSKCCRTFRIKRELLKHNATIHKRDKPRPLSVQSPPKLDASRADRATIEPPHAGQPQLPTQPENVENLLSNAVENMYQCLKCLATFPSFSSTSAHIVNLHVEERSNIPTYVIYPKLRIGQHSSYVLASMSVELQCKHCSVKFLRPLDFRNHIESALGLNTSMVYLAAHCLVGLTKQTRALSVSTDSNFRTCQKLKKSEENRLKHNKELMRLDEKSGNTCKPLSEKNKNMDDQQREHRMQERNVSYQVPERVKCAKCPNSFKNRSLLLRHMLTHSGRRPLKCDQPLSRRLHRQFIHSGEKRYRCNVCEYQSSQYSQLRAHKMQEHPHSTDNQNSCENCSCTSCSIFSLKRQELFHKDAFQCDECSASFKSKFTLSLHKRRHDTSAEPFRCDQCFMVYYRQVNLDRHIKAVHYSCGLCHNSFQCPKTLKRHIHSVHEDGTELITSNVRNSEKLPSNQSSLSTDNSIDDPTIECQYPQNELPVDHWKLQPALVLSNIKLAIQPRLWSLLKSESQ